MAGRIRGEDVQAVRERTDIVQVISGYLQLKKTGRDSLAGICPFHQEKTASLSVSPSKQVYHCFGCGEGGDVIRFVGKLESLSFVETVERLAQAAGVTLRYEGQTAAGRRAENRRQALHAAIAEAGRLYHVALVEDREGAAARRYLEGRGVSEGSVQKFGLGYAPGYPDYLLRRLSKSYSPDLLAEAGLVTRDQSGGYRDRFRGRVMFPIHDLSGNAVGFGGRLLPATEQAASGGITAAKYVNSPDGPAYHKGSLLYNLSRAKGDLTRSGRAFLVEGYTDVIGLDQVGVPNVVATCGTALGEDHVRLLARFTDQVVLAFDSDEAGARAAERAFQFHEKYPVQISVLVLPSGADPADFARASGGQAFLELAEGAVALVAYMIDRALRGRDLRDIEERSRAVRAGLAVVAALEDPVAREAYARLLAGAVGESENAVLLELERSLRAWAPPAAEGGRDRAGDTGRGLRSRMPPGEEVEWEVLKLIVQAPDLCAPWLGKVAADRFGKLTHRKVFEALVEAGGEGERGNGATAFLMASVQDDAGEQMGKVLAALAIEPPRSDGDPTNEYVERTFLRLEELWLKRQADALRKELELVNPLTSPLAHESLFERLIQLEGDRRRIRAEAEETPAS